MVVVIGAVCVWRRWEIQALLYVKLGLRLFDNAAKLDRTEGLTGRRNLVQRLTTCLLSVQNALSNIQLLIDVALGLW